MAGRRSLCAALVALLLAPVQARPQQANEPKTLKERLSDKASDQQRLDNCKVAPDRRGRRPRPDCPKATGRP
jgi:hypothetical protein